MQPAPRLFRDRPVGDAREQPEPVGVAALDQTGDEGGDEVDGEGRRRRGEFSDEESAGVVERTGRAVGERSVGAEEVSKFLGVHRRAR